MLLQTLGDGVYVCNCISELYCDCSEIYYWDEIASTQSTGVFRRRETGAVKKVQHIFSPLLHCGWLLKTQNHPFFMEPPWTKCSLHKTSTMGSFSSHGKLGTNDALLLPASSESLAFKSLPHKPFALMKSSKPVVKAPLRLYFPSPRQLQVLSSYTAVYHTQVYFCSCIRKSPHYGQNKLYLRPTWNFYCCAKNN